MDPGGTSLALQPEPKSDSTSSNTALTDGVIKAWETRCASLSEGEKKIFMSYACNGLADYLEKLEAACQAHADKSYTFKILDWFEPLFKVVELFSPALNLALQAYPNPGSIVLGGIVGIMNMTSRLEKYQKKTVQQLTKMGRKARILFAYERDVYKDDDLVQQALVQVYGDIMVFCQKAVRFLSKDGQVKAKVKGLKLLLWRDYESVLGEVVDDFENNMEDLESKAWLCDKKRLDELRKGHESHRNEVRQLFAESKDDSQQRDEIVMNWWKREQDLKEQADRHKKEKEKERSLEWLSTLSSRKSYDERCDEHLEGTGAWLLDSATYKKWKANKTSDLLWVRGKPGCGKSFLSAVAVADLGLEVNAETACAYAFCRRGDDSSRTNIFGALAEQICRQQPDINSALMSEFIASRRTDRPSHKAIRTIILSALSHFTRTFIVIDALDECYDHKRLAGDLLDVMRDSEGSSVNIIVFSRPDYDLQVSFNPYKLLAPDNGANEEDLKAYIEDLFPDDPESSVNKDIRKECIAKADGMFLWVKLLWQTLQKPLTDKQKLKRIRGIPSDLGSMYDHLLNDIWNQDEDLRSTAILVLLWVTHARRPLKRSEMLEAVADYDEATTLKEVSKLTNAEHLVAICMNLVFIDKDDCFRVCHESVRNHLDKSTDESAQPLAKYHEQKKHAQKRLAEICLNYLLLKDFDCGPTKSLGRLKALCRKAPFLLYAAKCWALHATGNVTSLLRDLILEVVLSPARREISMQISLLGFIKDDSLWDYRDSSNAMHILSINGLKEIAKGLPQADRLLREVDGSGYTPLLYALAGRHHEMSLWLIEQLRATPGSLLMPGMKSSPIHLCAELGWADVFQRLISEDEVLINANMDRIQRSALSNARNADEEGTELFSLDSNVNLNSQDRSGDTPLTIAVRNRHIAIVDLLLANGANPNCKHSSGHIPLHYAAENNSLAIAKALLKKGADPLAAAPTIEDKTPLHITAGAQSIEVMKILYPVHAESGMKAGKGDTPLHTAAWHNSSKSVRTLIDLGIRKNEIDNNKQTALFIAAHQGALDAVKVLIDAGCDVTIMASKSRTAIHAAAFSGKVSILRCILNSRPFEEWNTLVNHRSEYGEMPIHEAIRTGSSELVECLLEAGANGNAEGWTKQSPLHYAANHGYETISRLLLKHTKNANPRNETNNTPLHNAARAGKFHFIERFFQDCSELGLQIDLDAQDSVNDTPFKVALDGGYEEVARFLLEKGSDSIPNRDGSYPIHSAAWKGFDSIVQALQNKDGAKCKGYYGRTPFFIAAMQGHMKCVKLLAPTSCEILNEPDDALRTPVLAALTYRHLEVANYLLNIQVDHNAISESDNSLLHEAAAIGDVAMVQRLLRLGCKVSAADRHGNTPFHRAVIAGNVEIIDELIKGRLNDCNIPIHTWTDCTSLAARFGDLKMLRKFEELGIYATSSDFQGRTPAYMAAQGGHWEVLDYLMNRGEKLDVPDLAGETPLVPAAYEGHAETVKYLLLHQPRNVNDFNTWNGNSALIEAVGMGKTLTVRYLLAAGADPYHRDALGHNALDYATYHLPSMEAMRKAGYHRDPDESNAKERILHDTIRRCCKTLTVAPPTSSVEDLYYRLNQLVCLSSALLHVGDYDAAKICFMERFWGPKYAPLNVDFQCCFCNSVNLAGNKYVCKSCHRDTILCEACYKDYKDAGYVVPAPIQEIVDFEKQVQAVRVAVAKCQLLLDVCGAVAYFTAGPLWMSTLLEKYELWEQKHNSSDKYRELQRPGQEFLKTIKEARAIVSKINRDAANPFGRLRPLGDRTSLEYRNYLEDLRSLSKLSKQYELQRRKHRADQEITDFICKNHEYFLVSADEQEKLKSAGNEFDSETGRLTASFFESLLSKYSPSSSTLSVPIGNSCDELSGMRLQITGFPPHRKQGDLSRPNESPSEQQILRPQALQRSFTLPGPELRHRNEDVLLGSTLMIPKPISFLDDTMPIRSRRRRTLPIALHAKDTEDLQSPSIRVDMKDAHAHHSSKARIECEGEGKATIPPIPTSRQTVVNTSSVAPRTECETAAGQLEANGIPMETPTSSSVDPHAPAERSTSGIPLNSEPKLIAESRESSPLAGESQGLVAATTAAATANEEDDDESLEDIHIRLLRIAYLIFHNGKEDDEDMERWILALNVMEAMRPGFTNEHLQVKLEEQEEAMREQEKSESDSSD